MATDSRSLPASFIQSEAADPAQSWPGASPNFGQPVVPHIVTMAGTTGGSGRAYAWADEALRDSRENADKMRTDCGIMECLEARQRSAALLNWHIAPENEDSPDEKALADEMTRIIKRTPHFAKLRWAMGEARWYGRTGIALEYGKDWVNGKLRTVVKRWEPRHGDKLVFRYDDGRYQTLVDQVGIRIGGSHNVLPTSVEDLRGNRRPKIEGTQHGLVYWLDDWERRTMIVNKHIIEDGPFEDPLRAGAIHGIGIRDRIYWTWYGMVECLADVLCYLERSAFGIEIWKYPAGNAQARARAEDAAKKVTSGGRTVLICPVFEGENSDQFGVQHIEPGLAGVEQAMSIVREYFGHKIKRYILGQTLTSEAEATGLGSGVADAHLATFADIVRWDALNDEETLTTDMLRWMQLWNFPQSRGISLRFVIDTDSPDAEKKMRGYESAWNMGARIREEDVLSTIGASVPKDTDKTLLNPAIANAQQSMGPNVGGLQMPPQPPLPEEQKELLRNMAENYILKGLESLHEKYTLSIAEAAKYGAKWITIGGIEDGDKKHAGGFPVEIDEEGTILKSGGPSELVGKKVGDVKAHFDSKRNTDGKSKVEQSAQQDPEDSAESKTVSPKSMNFSQYLLSRGIKDPGADHSMLSPSGSVSNRARQAALDRHQSAFQEFAQAQRDYQEEINQGRIMDPLGRFSPIQQSDPLEAKRKLLLRNAATLRELAKNGLRPRKYLREAEKLEAEAAGLGREASPASESMRDGAVVNVPLAKRGDLNREIDRHKKIQQEKANLQDISRRASRTEAKQLASQHLDRMIEHFGSKPQFGGPANVRATLDSMAKWEPSKFVQFVDKFLREQGDAPASKYDAKSSRDTSSVKTGQRWVTIGGRKSDNDEHRGGFPVLLEADGHILAGGPKGLRGKHVSQVGDHFDQERKAREQSREDAFGDVSSFFDDLADQGKQAAEQREKNAPGNTRSFRRIVAYQAEKWGMEPETYEQLADQVWQDRLVLEQSREQAKRYARRLTGLNAGDLSRHENRGGGDYSSIPRFDEMAGEVKAEHPEFFQSGDDEADLWNLMIEGKQSIPSRTSREFHEAVDEMIEQELRLMGDSSSQDYELEYAAEQFTERGKVERYQQPAAGSHEGSNSVRTRILRAIGRALNASPEPHKYASRFNPEDHPRGQPDNAGQFVQKDGVNVNPKASKAKEDVQKRGDRLGRNKLRKHANSLFADASLRLKKTHPKSSSLMLNAAKSVTGQMSHEALKRVVAWTKSITMYSTQDELSSAQHDRNWHSGEAIAFFDPNDQSLHLDGGADIGGQDEDYVADIYAHEIAHLIDDAAIAIDGKRESENPDWIDAWATELMDLQLNANAATDEIEGWASFGELAILDKATAQEKFPKCYKYWQKRGLVT